MKPPLVVKLGSSLVVDAQGRPRRSLLRGRAEEIAEIVASGTPVCVVSSGAIALGMRRVGLTRRPTSLPKLQAASALGQASLQRAWQDALRPHGLEAAQILLTGAEIAERRAYVNARSALTALFSLGAIPVVNENDATATDEISFGDNDALAAQVAVLVRARLLVLLTSVPGVLSEGVLIEDGAAARSAVFGPGSALGRGGWRARSPRRGRRRRRHPDRDRRRRRRGSAVRDPRRPRDRHALRRRRVGARVQALAAARQARDRADHGRRGRAARGRRRGGSLLAVGVTGWDGDFRAGDGVELVGPTARRSRGASPPSTRPSSRASRSTSRPCTATGSSSFVRAARPDNPLPKV